MMTCSSVRRWMRHGVLTRLGPHRRVERRLQILHRFEIELEDALAARIGKSPSYISTLESNNTAPSLTTLRHIAGTLDTVVGAFFEQPGDASGRINGTSNGVDGVPLRVVRPETRKVLIDPAHGAVRWELLSPDLRCQMEVVQMSVARGAIIGEEEWLVHAGEECGIVLSGTLTVDFEHESFVLGGGDSLYFPSTLPHRIHNRSNVPAIAIWIITPPSF